MSILFKGRENGTVIRRRVPFFLRLAVGFSHQCRGIVAALGDLWRNPFASVMTIGVLGLSLSLPTVLYILEKNTQGLTQVWDKAAQITLVLNKDINSKQIDALQHKIKLYPQVSSVALIDKQQALKDFNSTSGFKEALSLLKENPLPDILVITAGANHQTNADLTLLLRELEKERFVDFGRLDTDWLQKLAAIAGLIESAINTLAVLLLFSVIFTVGNTIRMAIMARKEEIEIMKLVGATNSFIQKPFMYTGFWYGFLGSLVAILTVTILVFILEASINNLSRLYDMTFVLKGLSFKENLMLLAWGISLGLLGAWFAVFHYVRKIEPN